MDGTGVDGRHSHRVRIHGADANLNAGRRVYHAGFDRFVEHRAMVDPAHVVVGPCVGMGVEMDQAQRPVFFGMRLQDREADVMVAAHRDATCSLIQDAFHMVAQGGWKVGDFGIIEAHVAIIRHGELIQWRIIPVIWRIEGLQRTRLADRAWPEPRTRPVGHRLIEGHACNRQIISGQILGIRSPKRRGCAAEGVLERQPPASVPGKGPVHLIARVLQCH